MNSKKRILVCPLNWGLGHATRCIPIIRELINSGKAEVIIASSRRSLSLLRKEFPELEFIVFPDYDISYTHGNSLVIHFLLRMPIFFYKIILEHFLLKKMIKAKNIDIVISDNRFGLWNKKIYSIYITHQLLIKVPSNLHFFEYLIHKVHIFFINKYNECWIPDFEGEDNLSGELAHRFSTPVNAEFIGPLSRFTKSTDHHEKIYDLLVLISGPEPQRTVFENLVFRQIRQLNLKVAIVLGKSDEDDNLAYASGLTVYPYLLSEDLQQLIMQSKIVLSRSGYSTIMDMATIGNKAIFVPTPGQTEQEYLADYFYEKKIYYSSRQRKFNLKDSLDMIEQFPGKTINLDSSVLNKKILDILEKGKV